MNTFVDLQFQFLTKSVKTLSESRQQLMYMCIFAYFVYDNNQKEIFEMNQIDLHMATEALSRYLEEDITADNAVDLIQNVKNKTW